MFTGIIVVVRPVDVEATASGSVALSESDRLVASTWALIGRGSDAEMSLEAVTGCGTLLAGAFSSRSVINKEYDLVGRRRFGVCLIESHCPSYTRRFRFPNRECCVSGKKSS